MPQLVFNTDDPCNPQRFFAAWDTAGILLIEMVKRGATKTDVETLRRKVLDRYTEMIKTETGIPGLINIDMQAAEDAMQDVVDSIFDRVAFR